MPGPLVEAEDLEAAAGRIPIGIEKDLAAARMLQEVCRQLRRHQSAAGSRLLVEAEILRLAVRRRREAATSLESLR
jgi:hypothetical protein